MTMLVDFASDHLAQAQIGALRHLLVDVVARDDVRYVYVLDPEDRVVADSDPDDGPWLQAGRRSARARRPGQRARASWSATGRACRPPSRSTSEPGRPASIRLGLSTAGLERDLRALSHRNLVTGLGLARGRACCSAWCSSAASPGRWRSSRRAPRRSPRASSTGGSRSAPMTSASCSRARSTGCWPGSRRRAARGAPPGLLRQRHQAAQPASVPAAAAVRRSPKRAATAAAARCCSSTSIISS